MPEVTLQIYDTGYCTHPWHIVAGKGSWLPAKFPARVVCIIHPTRGEWLFDTGYAPRFHQVTSRWPEKIYALTTPVALGKSMAEQVPASQISGIILSHYHADHTAGLRDFPKIPIFGSRQAYREILSRSRFSNLRNGVLPSLLPEDFGARLQSLENIALAKLPLIWEPFTEGHDLFGDASVFAIPLPGHAAHQFGLACATLKGPVFLVADAIWLSLAYRTGQLPHPIARLLLDDWHAYCQTIHKLRTLYQNQPQVRILPCHCPEASHV